MEVNQRAQQQEDKILFLQLFHRCVVSLCPLRWNDTVTSLITNITVASVAKLCFLSPGGSGEALKCCDLFRLFFYYEVDWHLHILLVYLRGNPQRCCGKVNVCDSLTVTPGSHHTDYHLDCDLTECWWCADVFSWVNPEVGIALVPSTKASGIFLIGFWNITSVCSVAKHKVMIVTWYVQQDNLHGCTPPFVIFEPWIQPPEV